MVDASTQLFSLKIMGLYTGGYLWCDAGDISELNLFGPVVIHSSLVRIGENFKGSPNPCKRFCIPSLVRVVRTGAFFVSLQ